MLCQAGDEVVVGPGAKELAVAATVGEWYQPGVVPLCPYEMRSFRCLLRGLATAVAFLQHWPHETLKDLLLADVFLQGRLTEKVQLG